MSTRDQPDHDWPRVRSLVIDALDQPPLNRFAFVAHACGGDEALRRKAEAYLHAYERGEGVLKPPSTLQDLDPLVGQRIGRYVILRLIGCGGMGAVYQARQDQPSRIVALKLMRAAAISRSAQRRFEYESQLLARLHHPGIAQVYEAGTHDAQPGHPLGRIPYFAMEYVPHGVPITRFADIKSLDLRGRLALFVKVCEAVHHGHQNGVIHRDLKPANILVGDVHPEARADPDPADRSRPVAPASDSAKIIAHAQPKIIDFGVGRAIDADAPAVTFATTAGQIVGTLQYLAPERLNHPISGNGSGDGEAATAIGDVRCDVYALGVTLYELLAGRPPHALEGVALPEALRIIREVEPTPLSAIARELRGDVETIVSKAMEKDPQQRYQSAMELANDIGCFLRHEPISAHPHSATYHLRAFARRNRALVWGVAAAFGILVLAVIGVSAALTRSVRMERQALAERDRARKTVEFLKSMLVAANPTLADAPSSPFDAYEDPFGDVFKGQQWIPSASAPPGQRQYSAAELMEYSGRLLNVSFADEPELKAEVADTLGVTLEKLGLDAIPLLREAVDIRRRILGDEHIDTINSLVHLGMSLTGQGRAGEGEKFLQMGIDALKRSQGPDDARTLAASLVLSGNLFQQEREEEAIALLRSTLELAERRYGPDDPITLAQVRGLSAVLGTRDRDQAIALGQRAVDGMSKAFGADSIPVADALSNLAGQLRSIGEFDRAEKAATHALESYRTRFGRQTMRSFDVERQVFEIHRRQRRVDDAVADVRTTLSHFRQAYDPEHHLILRLEDRLARALLDAVEFHRMQRSTVADSPADSPEHAGPDDPALAAMIDEALALAQHAADVAMRIWGRGDVLTVLYHNTLAAALRVKGRTAEAERLARQWLCSAGEDAVVMATQQTLAACLIDLERFEEAERALRVADQWSRNVLADDRYEPRCRELLDTWLRLYERTQRPAEAQQVRQRLAEMLAPRARSAADGRTL